MTQYDDEIRRMQEMSDFMEGVRDGKSQYLSEMEEARKERERASLCEMLAKGRRMTNTFLRERFPNLGTKVSDEEDDDEEDDTQEVRVESVTERLIRETKERREWEEKSWSYKRGYSCGYDRPFNW